MLIKEKILKKVLAILLAYLLVTNPAVVPIVWAEGEESLPEETVVQEEIVEEPTEQPIVEEASEEPGDGGDATIETGDADSLAEVDTTANTNVDCLPGEVTTPEDPCAPPEVETGCSEGAVIANDNMAEVTDEAGSTATTGKNSIEGTEGDATIDTGDATAGADIDNTVNTNVVVLNGTEGTDGVEEEGICGEENDPALVVTNENDGTLTNSADVLADTGKNQTNENLGDAVINTGDALAWANLLNFLNTNLVGSNFEALFLDLLEGEIEQGNEEVNLNEIWKEILEKHGSGEISLTGDDLAHLQVFIQNLNQAVLENDVNVEAASGENQANENDSALIDTGDATALANVINFVNTNILGSNFFLFVINILGSYEGNLIFPRPEYFTEASGEVNGENTSQSSVVFTNQNQAEVEDQVLAGAQTGNNEELNNQGDNLIETGDAQAVANSLSWVNLNILLNNWFFLIINNLGNWTGQIFGWSSPEGVDEPTQGSQIYQLGGEGSAQNEGQGQPSLIFQNQNQATVKNNIQTLASTGQNQANGNLGDASILTGNARSLANLINFINLNILGGRWFFGLVNVLGDWQGDAIFAYPDVAVNLSNGSGQAMVGETTEYTLNYKNQGYDEAKDVRVEFELPTGMTYLGDSSGLTPSFAGQIYSWFIGTLGAGEEGSFTIQVLINPDFSFEEPLSFWSKLIPQVHAAENGKEKEVVAYALIGTNDPESDSSNNNASAKTIVYSHGEGVDSRQPVLQISAWNNVGEFVYPGDIVTFEIRINNTSDVAVYDTYLVQELFNGLPEEGLGTAKFAIGTLEPGEGGRLSFGLKLGDNGLLPADDYYTVAQAFGHAPNGEEVASNQATTEFEIRLKELGSLFEAKAVTKEEVLGVAECPEGKEDILPYVLLFLLSSLWLVASSRRILGLKAES